jgi:hypothetical protein
MTETARDVQDREMTFGERAVGLTFNPSKDPKVDKLKKLYAEIIDELDGMKADGENDRNRLCAIAITEAQGAQMWAVKAVTWR